jgi:hypothetical protein
MAISKSHWYFLYNSVVLQPFTFCLLGGGTDLSTSETSSSHFSQYTYSFAQS